MKKTCLILAMGLLLAGNLTAGSGPALAGTPPGITVGLAMANPNREWTDNRRIFVLDDPTTPLEDPDPINIVLTLTNEGGEVITSQGFGAKPFHLLLTFMGPDGGFITATELGSTGQIEPPPPQVLPVPVLDQSLQVEPVETLPGQWVLSTTIPNAHVYYILGKTGVYSVKATIAMRTYPAVDYSFGMVNYAVLDNSDWQGVLESASEEFYLVGDEDGDGYYYPEALESIGLSDCDDHNPLIHPGAPEIIGNGLDDDCDPLTADLLPTPKGTVLVRAVKHTVGTGSHPGSTKEPIVGMPVKLFDKSPTSCVSQLGVSWQNYQNIWTYCAAVPSGYATTQGDGSAALIVAPGNYLVVGRYDPDGAVPNDELFIGVSVGDLAADQTVDKYLQVIVKADGKKVPAKYTQKTGSELLIIEPEYIEWTGTQELYPFVFESLGDWTVTTAVTPPEGFEADYDSLSTEVDSSIRSVQFTVTDVGSKWVDTLVEHTLRHKGKTEVVRSRIGVKKHRKKKERD